MAPRQRFSFILLFAALLGLVGCGGASSSFKGTTEEVDGGSSEEITVSLTISDSNVAKATPVVLTATVMQGSTLLVDQLVSFSISDSGLASFDTDVSASGTDANGQAVITLLAGSSSGSGSVTASVDGINSNTVLFNSAGDNSDTDTLHANKIRTFASSQQLGSSGSDEIVLTTIAQDENNNLMEDVVVSFSATSGQIQVTNATTGADGQATAILKTSNEPANRVITITAQSGEATDTVDVEVKGTTIQLSGSSSLAINDESNFIVQVLNSEGEGVPDTAVALSLTPPATGDVAQITFVESITTDFNGQASFLVTGKTKGSNMLVASAIGATSTHHVSVQSDSLLFSRYGNGEKVVNPEMSALPDVLLSKSATIDVTWLQSGSSVADGTQVSFAATRGTFDSTTVSTVDGVAQATLSSTQAGKTIVTVTASRNGVTLNNQIEFEFVAETVANITAQASPSSIGTDGDTSTISVVVRDDNGNLVKGKIIDFTLSGTSNGTIFPASAVTDSNGAASTVYTSSTAISPQDGVKITATVKSTPAIFDIASLTVGNKELFIALGTGNTLTSVDDATYQKRYVAFVTDVDSTAMDNVALTVSAVPHNYRKGYWRKVYLNDEDGNPTETFDHWEQFTTAVCQNEDINFDGVLDSGEDTNHDNELTPGNVVTTVGEVTTDEQGRANIDITYAKSFAVWVDINLVVRAKVSGTENSEHTVFTIPILSSDVANENVPPPGFNSPFGIASDCANAN